MADDANWHSMICKYNQFRRNVQMKFLRDGLFVELHPFVLSQIHPSFRSIFITCLTLYKNKPLFRFTCKLIRVCTLRERTWKTILEMYSPHTPIRNKRRKRVRLEERTEDQAWKTNTKYTAYTYVGDESDAQPEIRSCWTILQGYREVS